MTRIVHAELFRLVRRRTIAVLVAATLLFAVVATLTVFSTASSEPAVGGAAGRAARPRGPRRRRRRHRGVRRRRVVRRLPRVRHVHRAGRRRVLGRHVPGAAAPRPAPPAGDRRQARRRARRGGRHRRPGRGAHVRGVAGSSRPAKDIATADWFSLAGVGAAVADYVTVFAGVAGWAIFGTTLAVIFRSAPLALGVGFAWAGPFENIVVDSWHAGYRFFPGQVLASLIQGGTVELGIGRAVLTAAMYVQGRRWCVTLVSRRDVTS